MGFDCDKFFYNCSPTPVETSVVKVVVGYRTE